MAFDPLLVRRRHLLETYRSTFFSQQWVAANSESIKALLPETWTHTRNIDFEGLCAKLSALGVAVSRPFEVAECMSLLAVCGLLKRDGFLVRRAR